MADEPGDDVFALFGDRALGRVWVPDIMLQAGENLRSVLEGKEEQENLAHLHKKYPGVALKITGDISTTILPDKRLHISILCRDRDVLDKVTADVKDLIESVCEHVADTIGIDADELEQAFAGMRMKKYVFSVEREEDDEESEEEEEDDACANAMPEKTETTTPSTAAQASPKTRPAEGASPQQQKASAGDDKGHAVADPIVIPDAGSDDESGGASTGGSDEDEEEEEEEEDAINESGSEMPHNDSASEMPLETRYDNDSASEMPLRREALEYTDTDADMMNSTDAEDVSRNHASFNERSRVLSPTELAKVKSQQRNEIRTAAVANLSPSNGKASDGLAPSGLQAAVSDMLARKCSPNWIVGSLKAKGYSLEQALSALKAIAVAKLQKPSVVACNLDSDSDEEEAPATLSAGGYDQLPEFLKARLPDWLRGGGQPPAKLEVQKPAMPLKPKATSPPLEPPKTPQPSRPRMSSQQLIAATALLGPGFEEATPEQLVAEFKKRGFTPADVVAKLKELQEAPVAKKLPLEATQGHHGTVQQQQQPPNKEDERFEQQEKATVEAPPWDSWEAVDSSQWDWPEQQQTSEAWNGGWEQARNDNGGYQEAQHNQAWESNAQWASAQGADNTEVYPVAPPGLVNQSGAADAQQQSAWSDPNGTWPQGQQWPTSSRHPLAVKKEQEEGQWQTSPQAPPGSNAHPLANTAGWSKLQTLIWMQQQRQQQAMAMQFQQQQIKQTMVVQQQHAMAMHQQLQQQALLMHQQRQQQALAMQMQQQASAASTSTIQGNTHNAICGERMPSPIGPSLVEVKTESSPELHSIAANVSSGVRVKAEDSRMEPAVAPSAPLQNFNLAVTQVKQETLEVASVQPSRPEFSDAKSKADSGLANATLQSFSAALTQVKQEIQEAAARKPTPEESPQKKKEAKEKVIAREKEADEKLKAMHEAVTDKREQAETKSTSATDVTSLVAVRTEAKWSDFKSKWSMPSAPKNWTSMFTAGSNGKPRNLRIFKGSVELRSLTLVHPCVIFGSSLQTAHIADTSHESVQPQHVALLWGASGHFLIDPFGGKVRVSSVQSHPDIAHAMTREARSMPNEEKAIELPIGSGKQLLFPTRCCFQLASSEIVFMVDLLPLPINLDRSDERRRPSVSRSPSDTRKTTRKKRQPPDKKHSPSRKQSRSLSLTRSLQNGERSKERRTPKAAKEARPQSRSQKRSLKDRSGARSPRPLVDKKERKDEQLGEKKKRKLNIRKKEGENRSSSRRKDRRREETKDAAKSSKLMTLMTEVKSEEESEAEDEDVFAAQEQEWRTDKSKDEKASDSKAKAIEKRVASKTEKTSTLEARAEDDRDTKRRIRDDSTKAKRKREDERRSPRRKEQTPAKETGNLRKQDEKARGKQKDSKEPKGKGTEYACQSSKRDERDSRKRKSAKEATLEDEVKSEEESGTGDRNNRSKGSSTKARNALFAEKKDKGNGDKNSTKTKSAKEVGRRSASKAKKEQRRDSNRERCSRTPPRKATHLDRRGTCGNSSSASNRNKLRSRGSCETRRGRKRSPST